MKIHQIRHATSILIIKNKKILIDPMLGAAGSMPPIPNVPNQNPNPLVDLPVDMGALTNCDAILVTHTHRDHFDDTAAKQLYRNTPILCQPQDEVKLKSHGFIDVKPITNNLVWEGITFERVDGKHGHDELAVEMAPVSGFVISCMDEPTIYIAGDTVWCSDVYNCLDTYNPDIIVCNFGGAQFGYGKPITMSTYDLQELCSFTNQKIVAVHMDAWNHCRLSRKELRHYITANNFKNEIIIPEDGELVEF